MPLPPSLESLDAIVFDFDGVLTDDRVWVDQDGREMVCCSRRDDWLSMSWQDPAQTVHSRPRRAPSLPSARQSSRSVPSMEHPTRPRPPGVGRRGGIFPGPHALCRDDLNDFRRRPVCLRRARPMRIRGSGHRDVLLVNPGGSGIFRDRRTDPVHRHGHPLNGPEPRIFEPNNL